MSLRAGTDWNSSKSLPSMARSICALERSGDLKDQQVCQGASRVCRGEVQGLRALGSLPAAMTLSAVKHLRTQPEEWHAVAVWGAPLGAGEAWLSRGLAALPIHHHQGGRRQQPVPKRAAWHRASAQTGLRASFCSLSLLLAKMSTAGHLEPLFWVLFI